MAVLSRQPVIDEGSTVERSDPVGRRFVDHELMITFVVVVVVAGIAFAPQIFNDAVFPWDFLGSASTAPPFVAESIGDGRWPTWSNFVASGQALPLDAQSGLYYPIWWIFGVLDVPLSVTFLAKIHVAHVVAGAMGMALLARARGIRGPLLPVVAAAFVMFGGFYSQAQHVTAFRGFALFPWLLWALTIPRTGSPTRRVVWLPLIVWLAVAGIYPGQIVSFAVLGLVYLGVDFWPNRDRLPSADYPTVVLAGLVSMGIAVTVLVPYLLASSEPGLLLRPFPPTVQNLDIGSLKASTLLGALVSPWGFRTDGSVSSLYVGAPVLLGLSGVTRSVLTRQRPLVVTAIVATVFAGMGSVTVIAELMLKVDLLFASRFPFSDYKIGMVVPVLVLSIEGWRALLRREIPVLRPAWVAVGLVFAVWLSRDVAESDPASRWPWLLAVIGLSFVLAVRAPRQAAVAGLLLVVLVSYDGVRAHSDLEFAPIQASPWVAYMDDAMALRWSNAAHDLENALDVEPAVRPARIPPIQPIEDKLNGRPSDSFGFLATDYYLASYSSFVPRVRFEAQTDPLLLEYLSQAWTAWVIPCTVADCDGGATSLPLPVEWGKPSSSVTTTRYGVDSIDYAVDVVEPVLLVENELNYPGWRSSSPQVSLVDHEGSFRAWVLQPGQYSFTAEYRDESLDEQLAALVITSVLVAAFVVAVVVGRRKRRADG